MVKRKQAPAPRSFSRRPAPAVPARPDETFEAIFLGHPEGTGGFLRPAAAGTRPKAGMDLLVDWRDGHQAIHGDRVLAEVTGLTYDGRARGRVVRILSRNPDPVPAHLHRQDWGWQAIPLEPRFTQIVSVPPSDLAGDGDLVTVLLDPEPKPDQVRGRVLARLGRPSDLRIENKLTAALYNLRTDFPDAVMHELAQVPTELPEAWLKGREDVRGILTVTVDPPTAKDFDDAISLEVLDAAEDGGWLLGVHIADVSHYVAEGGPLDREALARGTSVYFPDQCIPMLPERLSGELCSLREGVDRLTFTAWLTLGPDLEVREARLAETVIRSRRRLTYDQVKEACIDQRRPAREAIGSEACEMLDEALRVSRSLTAKRLGRGALNLDSEETEFQFDAEGRPVGAVRASHHEAHRMIEEFMLLANEAVARFFTRRKLPAVYRIHDNPDPLKLEAFKEVAGAFGLIRPFDPATPEVLNALLEKIRGGPLEAMLNTLLVRSLKRAEYSADNIGHSGLALQDYLHFTSPIRRYPDLVVHRNLRKVLRGERLPDGLHGHLAIVAKQCTDTEQTATEAERENDRWKTCLVLKSKIGQRFEGRIQGFSLKAAFVRLDNPFLEVGVPLGALGGAFSVDEHRTHASNGQSVVLSIGDWVRVEITGVDEDLRRVSGWVVEAKARDGKGKAVTFVPNLAAPATLREADFVPERPARPGRPPRSVREAQGGPGRGGRPGDRSADRGPRGRSEDRRPAGRSEDRGPGGRSEDRGPGSRKADRGPRADQGGARSGRPAREGAHGSSGRGPKPPKGSVRGGRRGKG